MDGWIFLLEIIGMRKPHRPLKWWEGGGRERNGKRMEGSNCMKWIWLAVRWLAKFGVFNLSLTFLSKFWMDGFFSWRLKEWDNLTGLERGEREETGIGMERGWKVLLNIWSGFGWRLGGWQNLESLIQVWLSWIGVVFWRTKTFFLNQKRINSNTSS